MDESMNEYKCIKEEWQNTFEYGRNYEWKYLENLTLKAHSWFLMKASHQIYHHKLLSW